jgi:hypothetical protein
MPDSLYTRPRRAKGSWVPRLVGVGVVAAVAAGGVVYFGLSGNHSAASRRSRGASTHPTLSARVVGQQTVGLINFGPYDDKDPFSNDPDDHPLMLEPSSTGLRFVVIPPALLATGQPQWTADQMADGSDIFIYIPSGKCLAAGRAERVGVTRCASVRSQRWRQVQAGTYFGQAFAAYANAQTGLCLTAPVQPTKMKAPAQPGPATLSPCGPARTTSQEMAFWWTL